MPAATNAHGAEQPLAVCTEGFVHRGGRAPIANHRLRCTRWIRFLPNGAPTHADFSRGNAAVRLRGGCVFKVPLGFGRGSFGRTMPILRRTKLQGPSASAPPRTFLRRYRRRRPTRGRPWPQAQVAVVGDRQGSPTSRDGLTGVANRAYRRRCGRHPWLRRPASIGADAARGSASMNWTGCK
jgi:hypothetical protein